MHCRAQNKAAPAMLFTTNVFVNILLARSVSNLLDNISSGISMLAQNLRRNLHLRLWHIRVALVLSTSDF